MATMHECVRAMSMPTSSVYFSLVKLVKLLQTSNGQWCLSSSVGVVCSAAHMQRNWPWAARGGPVVLRPVRATLFCFIIH